MKFARILFVLALVLLLLGMENAVDAKASKSSKKKNKKPKNGVGTMEEALDDMGAKVSPEEAQANLEAAMEKERLQREALAEAKEQVKEEDSSVKEEETPPPKKKGKRSSKDWSKISERDLEKAWEQGDAEDELEHEYDHSQKVIEKKRALIEKEQRRLAKKKGGKAKKGAAAASALPAFNPDDPESVQAALAAQQLRDGSAGPPGGMRGTDFLNTMTGTAMYFTDITPVQMSGKQKGQPWDKTAVDNLAGYWSSMLKSAHLSVNVYNLGATNKEGQMLVSIDKGWQTKDIMKFLFKQPEMVKMTKDRQEFTKAMFAHEDDDDDL